MNKLLLFFILCVITGLIKSSALTFQEAINKEAQQIILKNCCSFNNFFEQLQANFHPANIRSLTLSHLNITTINPLSMQTILRNCHSLYHIKLENLGIKAIEANTFYPLKDNFTLDLSNNYELRVISPYAFDLSKNNLVINLTQCPKLKENTLSNLYRQISKNETWKKSFINGRSNVLTYFYSPSFIPHSRQLSAYTEFTFLCSLTLFYYITNNIPLEYSLAGWCIWSYCLLRLQGRMIAEYNQKFNVEYFERFKDPVILSDK